MKKLIASLVIFSTLLLSTPAHALTLSDLQNEVESLKTEIASLRSMMSGQVLGAVAPSVTYSLGMKSPDLIKYQQSLIDQKYLGEGNATGVFGTLTFTAVKNFQIAKGLKADGVLGGQTQLLLLGGQTQESATGLCRERIKVLSPNGGEFYQAGSEVTINWSTCDVPSNAQIKIELEAWGNFPAYTFGNTVNDGTEVFTLPTTATLPGMQYGLGYKVAATYTPKTTYLGEPSYYRDFSDNLFTINSTCIPNTWNQKANVGSVGRYGAAGFSIGNKGYVGTGGDGSGSLYKEDFWEYDPITNIWTQRANFGGGIREGATGFSIGDKGYLGTGLVYNTVTNHNDEQIDFYEYNPANNTWTQKTDFPGIPRGFGTSFSIDKKGYLGDGGYRDFYEFDPAGETVGWPAGSGSWTRKSNLPGEVSIGGTSFVVNGKGYVIGLKGLNDETDAALYEYNPVNNYWAQKAYFGEPGAAYFGIAFAIGDKGYAGVAGSRIFKQYNPVSNEWVAKKKFPDDRSGAVGFSIGNKGYAGTGNGLQKDFWEYCPD